MTTETPFKSPAKTEQRKNAWKNLPDVWALIKPRRGLLALGFVLMAINRLAGLVLPASTKYLVDNVISKQQIQLLTRSEERRVGKEYRSRSSTDSYKERD